MVNKEREFLSKLADLMEEYNVEFENCLEFIGPDCFDDSTSSLDINFESSPYTVIHFNEDYIGFDLIREKAKEY